MADNYMEARVNSPRSYKILPNAGQLGPSQTSTFAIPVGVTYFHLDLYVEANTGGGSGPVAKADWGNVIGDIRLSVDGEEKMRVPATMLIAMAEYYGQTVTDGVLPIYLARPQMETLQGQDATAYGTADVQNMSLEVDILGVSSIDKLDLYAEFGNNTPLGAHLVIRRKGFQPSATGELQISDIPRANYNMFALHADTAAISEIEVEADTRELISGTREILAARSERQGKAWQAGYTHIDFANNNRLSGALPMVWQDFRVKLEMTQSGGNHSLYSEEIHTKPVR